MASMMPCRTNKRKFKTELDAKIVLAELQARDQGQKRIYKCSLCGGFHITSQDRNPPKIDTNHPN